MRALEKETSVEVLREYAVLATAETFRLRKLVDQFSSLIGESAQAWLKDHLSGRDLSDQFSRLQKKFYGFGREQLEPTGDRPIGKRLEQLKLHGERGHDDENPVDKPEADQVASAPEVVLHPMTDEALKSES